MLARVEKRSFPAIMRMSQADVRNCLAIRNTVLIQIWSPNIFSISRICIRPSCCIIRRKQLKNATITFFPVSWHTIYFLLTWILCQLSQFLTAYLGVPAPCVPAACVSCCFLWVLHRVGACQGVPAPNIFLCLLAGVPALNSFGSLLRCARWRGVPADGEKRVKLTKPKYHITKLVTNQRITNLVLFIISFNSVKTHPKMRLCKYGPKK